MCVEDTDCQENAFCFLDEVHKVKTGNMIFETIHYAIKSFIYYYFSDLSHLLHNFLLNIGEDKADCICKLGMYPELGRNPTDDIYPK